METIITARQAAASSSEFVVNGSMTIQLENHTGDGTTWTASEYVEIRYKQSNGVFVALKDSSDIAVVSGTVKLHEGRRIVNLKGYFIAKAFKSATTQEIAVVATS